MFLSSVFTEAFVNVTGVPVELYNCDGSVGAAIGAGIGSEYFSSPAEAFQKQKVLSLIQPVQTEAYDELYERWKGLLELKLT